MDNLAILHLWERASVNIVTYCNVIYQWPIINCNCDKCHYSFLSTVLLAVAVPTIGPFIGLIGAFCFSILGLIIPIFIEMVTYWDIGFGPGSWVIIKNIFLFIFGLFALVFGTKMSIADITKMYMEHAPVSLNITDSNFTSTVLP